MSFHSQSFGTRFNAMGDEAEQIFETVHPHNWLRFGLNRPPLQMSMLPTRVRYTPDYLTSHGFVEVKGCGKDQVLKLKVENLNALHYWNQLFETRVFVWDSYQKRYGSVSITELQWVIDNPTGGVTLDHFHDGKAYFRIPLGQLPADWTRPEGENS